MRFLLACLSVLIGLSVPAAAHGDTVFSLQGKLQDGTGTFTGNIVYLSNYQSYGRVTGTITDGSYTFMVPSNYLGETINDGTVTHVDVFSVGAAYDLSLYLPNSILAGNAGGPLCSLANPCVEAGGSVVSSFGDYDRSGNALFARQSFATLTATPQVTPEPDTFILLGTGMVAVAFFGQRRGTTQQIRR